MFEQFPYTNFHDLNLDWIIEKVKAAYSPDNPPDFAVLSVNGETGAVVLYKDAQVHFPDVEEGTWNIFRKADNQETGIQFIKNQPAQRIAGVNRYNMYDAGNPPPYPVTSVDGHTGTVHTWADSGNADLTLPQEADGDIWALRREGPSGYLGIQFELDESDDPCGYFILKADGSALQKIKILTPADIPSSAGVVSINGEAGVVVLTGADLDVSSTDTRSISEALDDIIDDEYQMDNTITYTERGDTATQNIPLGKYVIWKNNPYISIASISTGDTLSSSNLVALDHGIVDNMLQTVNSLVNQINTLNSNKANYEYGTWTPNIERMTITAVTARYVKIGSIYICSAKFAISALGTGNPYINGASVPGYVSATHNSIEGNWSSSADTFGQLGNANNNNIWFAKNGAPYGMTNEVGKDVHMSFIVFPT